MNLFGAAHCLLESLDSPGAMGATTPAALPNEGRDAAQLLLVLGYAAAHNGRRLLQPTARTTAQRENRLALLRLAARLERVFQLPMRNAPGGFFFGGRVSPRAVGLVDHTAPAMGVAGRGQSFRQAFESCLGEAAEYLSFIEWGEEPRAEKNKTAIQGRDGPVLTAGSGFEHGLTEAELTWALMGIGLSGPADSAQLDWIAAAPIAGGRSVGFPAELCLRRTDSMRQGRRAAESNGVAAGCTWRDAVLGGLMETVERDAVALWWFGHGHARKVHPSITEDPEFRCSMAMLRAPDARPHKLLDLTTDIGVPVMAALSAEGDGSAVVAGFAAALDPVDALRGAVLEMCQMELAQALAVAKLERVGEQALLAQERVWVDRYRRLTLDEFSQFSPGPGSALAHHPPTGDSLAAATSRLEHVGLRAFSVNLTRPTIGIPVARILVPGLQSAKADWVSQRLRKVTDENKIRLADIITKPCPI